MDEQQDSGFGGFGGADGFDGGDELVRQQTWPADGPAELELSIDVGRVDVTLSDTDEVWVEVRHDPAGGNAWTQGITGIFTWIGTAGGTRPGAEAPEDVAAEAVRAAEIRWSETGRRLVVRSSQELPLRMVPLAVTVRAPLDSRHAVRTGAGDVTVTGRAGWAAVKTGSGDVRLEETAGDADVTTGSGEVALGPVTGRARVRTGSGQVSVAAMGGPSQVKTGSGDVRVGEVAGDLGVRTGSGEVTVADAVSGTLDLTTGSGGLRVGVHSGVAAEVDLSSGSGKARSDLEVGAVAPQQAPALRIRGRAGSGDVLVTRATAAA